MAMPHPAEFAADHGPAARKQPSTCSRCHTPDECLACHQSLKPKDHTEEFALEHKGAAKGHVLACVLCHQRDYCSACHDLPELAAKP